MEDFDQLSFETRRALIRREDPLEILNAYYARLAAEFPTEWDDGESTGSDIADHGVDGQADGESAFREQAPRDGEQSGLS